MVKSKNKIRRKLILYSDGGVVNNGGKDKNKDIYGSYCFVLCNKNYDEVKVMCKVEKDVTNNIMELKGAMAGIKYIANIMKKKHSDELLDLVIISDSQYLIKGCSEWMPNWKKNKWKNSSRKIIENVDLWKEMDELLHNEQISFTFEWVRGHKGKSVRKEDDVNSYYNEMCDTILTEALKEYR